MPDLFYLSSNLIQCYSLASDRPTRLDARGAITRGTAFAVSIVPLSQAPIRFAVVSGEGAHVAVGPWRVCAASPLADGDHLFVEGREFLLSLDSPPLPVESPRDAPCPVCDGPPASRQGAGAALQFACPRCGARACAECWRGFRGGVCLTPHCHQPAALERALFRPAPTDFLDFAGDEPRPLAPG